MCMKLADVASACSRAVLGMRHMHMCMYACACAHLSLLQEENNKPSAEEDAFEELKKVFGKFARAEVVMGLEKDESDEEVR